MPLSQQPVFMHADWRTPQLVMQIDSVERSGFFLQLVMQMVCSPLHRMAAAKAVRGKSGATTTRKAEVAAIMRVTGAT